MGQANRKSKDPAVRCQMAIERDRRIRSEQEDAFRQRRAAEAARIAALPPAEREAVAERERAAQRHRGLSRGVLAATMAFACLCASGSARSRW